MHEAAEVIRAHHETYDGHCYPEGISKDAIPLGARILAVADEFDGLLIGNECRKPMSAAKALAYISNQSGKRFDPDVIDALVTLQSSESSDDEIASISRLKLQDLREGMILAEDLKNEDDLLLLPEGFRMTESLIKRLRDHKNTGAGELILSISTQSIIEPELRDENATSEES